MEGPKKSKQDSKSLVSRIFRAMSKAKNQVLLHKGFRNRKSGMQINKDTNLSSSSRISNNVFAFIILAWIIYSVILGALYIRLPPNPDNSIYDYIGWIINRGGILYVDVADQNFPGMFLFHVIATLFFGNHLWSFRLLEFIFATFFTGGFLFLFTKKYQGLLAAYISVPIYQAMYVSEGFWFAGQRDYIASTFLLSAIYFLLLNIETKKKYWSVLQGLSLSMVVLIRPTLIVFFFFLIIIDYFFLNKNNRSFKTFVFSQLVALISFAFVVIVLIVFGSSNGSFQEWINVSIKFNLEVYGEDKASIIKVLTPFIEHSFINWKWYFIMASFGGYIYWRKYWQVSCLIASAFITTLISGIVQMKGFPYHLGGVFCFFSPLISPIVASSVKEIYQYSKPIKRYPLIVFVIFYLTFSLYKTSHKLSLQMEWYLGRILTKDLLENYGAGADLNIAQAVELADYVSHNTHPNCSVLFWGRPMLVNYLSERISPIRFVSFTLIDNPTENFSLFRNWENELLKAFSLTPPELVIIVAKPGVEGYIDFQDPTLKKRLVYTLIKNIKKNYVFEKHFYSVDIYRLQGTDKNTVCQR